MLWSRMGMRQIQGIEILLLLISYIATNIKTIIKDVKKTHKVYFLESLFNIQQNFLVFVYNFPKRMQLAHTM